MANLAIIPARGGSKRIPRKNCKDFLGKPIIAYSIENAMRSYLFDEVMVSTDDEEIASIARQYGAKVPFMRSLENSNDYATTIDVINEVLEQYRVIDLDFDNVCCIYPTAPLLQISDLVKGLDKLINGNYISVFPIAAFSYPIWRGLELVDEKVKMVWPEYLNSRSQDLKSIYHDAGQWYWMTTNKLGKALFTENSSSIVISEEYVQDIDTETDWVLAEIKYKLLHAK